jgi:hypothetical protein
MLRNEKNNQDRALALIKGFAETAARESGETAQFFMTQMIYRRLVPIMRALMGPKARCQACGHGFANELDIQIDHRYPPRHAQDWARLHAGNLWLICSSCHDNKGAKDFQVWLDDQWLREQEAARR